MAMRILLGVMLLGAGVHAETVSWLPEDYALRNLAPHAFPGLPRTDLPIKVAPFEEHMRGEDPPPSTVQLLESALRSSSPGMDGAPAPMVERFTKASNGEPCTAYLTIGKQEWFGSRIGLFHAVDGGEVRRHPSYGVDGPLATQITALAAGPEGTLWVGTPIGLSRRGADGAWTSITGRDGLPLESITALEAGTRAGDLWIGTAKGVILYRPGAEGRKWFYREGKRYLPNDHVLALSPRPEGGVYVKTEAGWSTLEVRGTTLLERARAIEARLNDWHRREGLVSSCVFDQAEHPTTQKIYDNDNDGLWTAYHVAAMSLCYGATKDEAAKQSAIEGMHAMYLLENASGTPGLVARSVLPLEEGKTRGPQWRPSPDGAHYWKSDTSNDEIDGHYLAFYTFFEHIAKDDPTERALLEKQVRAVTDYIVGNGYQLVDWTGRRTSWGFWDPKSLNENPSLWAETGLNSLQMLSFLKVAHQVTGEPRYEEHYRKLALDGHYLENVMHVKRTFPEPNNHSDDQLGFVAWYPLLQLEQDPKARQALLRGVRHHYEIVREEQPSFFTFVYATIDSAHADLEGAIENLRQIPTDRRNWAQKNSARADVQFDPHPNRFRRPVLTRALPADERVFEKWNGDPYEPDGGGDGKSEDDGAAFLLPYWMGRFHGFIAEQ